MNGSTELALLRRVAAGHETPADRARLAERVRAYLDAAPRGASLDAAFGLAGAPGVLPWWRVEAIEARDAALRALAARFHAGQPRARQASAIRAALLAYAASAWRFDRREAAPPVRYLGTPAEHHFDALRACDAVPSAAHIRRVLRG